MTRPPLHIVPNPPVTSPRAAPAVPGALPAGDGPSEIDLIMARAVLRNPDMPRATILRACATLAGSDDTRDRSMAIIRAKGTAQA